MKRMRLIDKGALFETIANHYDEIERCAEDDFSCGELHGLIWAEEAVRNAPTVDVKDINVPDKPNRERAIGKILTKFIEPKRGRWIEDEYIIICSNCREPAMQRVFYCLTYNTTNIKMEKTPYCPHCGAAMTEGGEMVEG